MSIIGGVTMPRTIAALIRNTADRPDARRVLALVMRDGKASSP